MTQERIVNSDYVRFKQAVRGDAPDDLPKDEETSATAQEIGWWKQHQYQRSLRHLSRGEATKEEVGYLQRRGVVPCRAARERVKEDL